ncbi:MAG: CPBP family intramembrane glutamic endopeptidase, partial [Planctomycetota bacterium]
PPPVLGESGLGYFATLMIVGQVACIALPAVLVATTLARDWRRTLLLDRAPRGRDIALATSLAVALHPAGQLLAAWVSELYPLSDSVQQQLEGFMGLLAGAGEPPIAVVLLLMAALPAVCEELAFRGVILSGLRKTLGDVGAVLATAAVFGATHSILAQQVAAAPVGAVIGLVALRTGSLWPCIVLHGVYNALQLLTGLYADAIRKLATTYGVDGALFGEMKPGQLGYSPAVAILGCVAAIALWRAMGTPSGGRPHPGPAATAAS